MPASLRRVLVILGALCVPLVGVGCAGQAIARVQAAHGHEFSCDRRYVRVERVEAGPADGERWVSRGCAFEADWDCAGGECRLLDSRAHGMGAP